MRPVCSDEPRFLNTSFLLLNPVWQEWVMHLPTYTYMHAYHTAPYITVQYRIWYDMTWHDTTRQDRTWHDIHTYMYICMYTCMHIFIYKYLYIISCICTQIYVLFCIHDRGSIPTYVHIYSHPGQPIGSATRCNWQWPWANCSNLGQEISWENPSMEI